MIVVATYIRVSTLGQAENGYSLEDQQQRVVAFIERQGWILPDHLRFQDGGISGASLTAPGLNRMLDAARERQFQYLVVPSVDRFARNMVKALNLEAGLAIG